jgi:hypothetical protein
MVMKMRIVLVALVAVGVSIQIASAQPLTWSTFRISKTGTTADFPSSVFSEQAGRPPGVYGQRFRTADHNANLTIQSAANNLDESPAAFLKRMHPPQHIQYKRVTSRFFVVSSYKGNKVWYDRCNFSGRFIHCVLINYPASQQRTWDDIVTRISLSLRPR